MYTCCYPADYQWYNQHEFVVYATFSLSYLFVGVFVSVIVLPINGISLVFPIYDCWADIFIFKIYYCLILFTYRVEICRQISVCSFQEFRSWLPMYMYLQVQYLLPTFGSYLQFEHPKHQCYQNFMNFLSTTYIFVVCALSQHIFELLASMWESISQFGSLSTYPYNEILHLVTQLFWHWYG